MHSKYTITINERDVFALFFADDMKVHRNLCTLGSWTGRICSPSNLHCCNDVLPQIWKYCIGEYGSGEKAQKPGGRCEGDDCKADGKSRMELSIEEIAITNAMQN